MEETCPRATAPSATHTASLATLKTETMMKKRTKQEWAHLFEDYEDFKQSYKSIASEDEYVDARKLSVTSLLLYDFLKLDWVDTDGFGYRPVR